MRHFLVILLLAVAHLAHAETYTNTFTATGSGTIVYLTATPPLPSVPQTGTYTLAGTFVGTMAWEYSPNGQNFVTLNTYTTTVGPVNMSQPGYYQWVCTAYTSGTVTSTIFKNYLIYQQQLSNAGVNIFQLDDSGLSYVGGSGGSSGTFSSVKVTGTTASTTPTTGAITDAGGLGVSGAGYFGGLINSASTITGTALAATATTASTSPTTGAITDAGGFGLSGAANLGSTLTVLGAMTFGAQTGGTYNGNLNYVPADQFPSWEWKSGATTVEAQTIVDASSGTMYQDSLDGTFLYRNGINGTALVTINPTALTAAATTASTSPTTGAVVDGGGFGAAGAAWIGGLLNVAGAGTIQGILTAGGTSAPSANTFAGNKIWGGNNGTSYTAGSAGEYIEQQITTLTNAASTGTYLALATVTLSAGNWDINATALTYPNSSTFVVATAVQALIGTASGTSTGAIVGYNTVAQSNNFTTGSVQTLNIGPVRVQITSSTPYYLNVLQTFSAGTPQWRGSITARRAL